MQSFEEALPVTQVTPGMSVVDGAGADIGKVTAVQEPGTGIRPDLPAGEAEHLMATGYFRVDGGGLVSSDFYVGASQIAEVGDVVTLTVAEEDLRRAL